MRGKNYKPDIITLEQKINSKSYVAVSTIIVLVLFGLIMIATTYGYYMLDLRKAVELKYSNGSRYWQTDDIETIPKEIADLV